MRINTNHKIHKMKRDPYQLLLRVTLLFLGVAVLSAVVFALCNNAVQTDYRAKRAEIEKINIDGEQEFNAKLNELINSQNAAGNPAGNTAADQQALAFWETTLEEKAWRLEDEGYADLENTYSVTVDRQSLIVGGLLLVNPWHPLPADFSDATLVSVGNTSGWKIAVTDGNVRLFPVAFDALQTMVNDAATAGLADYIVREAYRSNDTQTELFNKQMEKLSSKYSGDILIEQTKKTVNYPGTSEFQSGMAFSMGLYNKEKPEIARQKFQETDQGKWFTDNSWKYGVVFRFPTQDFLTPAWEDKSYKTGVSAQLNLYRYVGQAHATAMRIMGYCLEEYIEFLAQHPHICIYEDGALRYEIYRMEVENAESYDVPVPNPASGYTASLDNLGGLVMAYTYQQ
ncbi:MAG: M15 family metallopeptidase [Candidatus Limiplasma sp.]|nr:M15 family metallopeptidase [Candidatus Limiplasma sp.]